MFQSGAAMLSKSLVSLLSLSLIASAVPSFAGAVELHESRHALADCYSEAQWPVTSSSAYTYGNARQREQLTNGFDREVHAMRRVCYGMQATGDKATLAAQCGDIIADSLKTHGAAARDHAVRQRRTCEALSGQSVVVDGL